MKSILVPTDFSTCSINAVHYAADLANHIQAKIVLFHAFHPPVMVSEVPDMLSITEMKDLQIENLEKLATEIKAKHGENLQIETVCESGFAVDEIQIYQEENENDLIIMGMKHVGQFTEKVIGSLTTTLMYKSFCPILSIPENYSFKSINEIVLATDFNDSSPNLIFEPLIAFIETFDAHLHLLNVAKNVHEMVEASHSATEEKYKKTFETIKHSVHYIKNESVVEGINHFITSREMDLVVMIPKKHTFWENILHEPQTKKIAFHANIPVMALSVNI
jgi:nucleotide-binding universal stress UspA family protein